MRENPYQTRINDDYRINAEGQVVRNVAAKATRIALERFMAMVEIAPEAGYAGKPCWLWTGYIQPNGYGQFKPDGRRGAKISSPHRFAYEHYIGPIPDGFEVDHLCRRRNCCNPAHLEAVTVQVNRKRRDEDRTHCKRGHEFAPGSMRLYGNTRICRPCAAERARDYRKRHKF